VLFYVVETVTAEAAGSSPVVPAILSQELNGSALFSRGHKKAQNRYTKQSSSTQGLHFFRFFWEQKRDDGFLRVTLLGCNRLRVRIQRHANR
jgi:hypothetical protein